MEQRQKVISKKLLRIFRKPDRSLSEKEKLIDFLCKFPKFERFLKKQGELCEYEVAKLVNLEEVPKNSKVLDKGLLSKYLYFIVSGEVNLFKETLTGSLEPGNFLCKKATLTQTPQNYTAVSKKPTTLLKLKVSSWLESTSDATEDFDAKLQFLRNNFPKVTKLSQKKQVRFACMFEKCKFYKRDIVFQQGAFKDVMYVIAQGECLVSQGSPPQKVNLMLIGPGCCLGDECVLLDKSSEMTYSVTSDSALLYKVKKTDLLSIMPEDVLEELRALTSKKILKRKQFSRASLEPKKSNPNFKHASPKARYSLKLNVLRQSLSTHLNPEKNQLRNFKRNKDRLENLRSSSRLLKFSSANTSVIPSKSFSLKSLTSRSKN